MRHTPRWISGTLMLALGLAGVAPSADADLVQLSNGQTMEGIVVQQTPQEIRLQIDWQGYTTLDRTIVSKVMLEDRVLNQTRLASWRRDHAELLKRQDEQDAYEADQRSKGLIKRGDDWVTPEALALMRQAETDRAQQELQRQIAALTERIQNLEEENRALRQELSRPREQIFAVPGAFLIHHQPRFRGEWSLFRDEQGNTVRVRNHDNHRFFTTPDGSRVTLETRNGRIGFADTTGIFHELTPAPR